MFLLTLRKLRSPSPSFLWWITFCSPSSSMVTK
jgi:hypothetical protein